MEVFRLQMRGVNQAAMAKVLGVNRNTIIRDVQWLRNHTRELATEADKFGELGDAMKAFEEIERTALFQFHETDSPHAKNNFLMTALTAREKKVRLMADMGIIEKAALDVNMNVDYGKMTTEELLQVREKLLKQVSEFGVEGVGRRN